MIECQMNILILRSQVMYLPAAAGAAAPAGAAPAPDPMLLIRFLTSTPSKAFAKRLGQYGSTSTLAAFRSVAIFSP